MPKNSRKTKLLNPFVKQLVIGFGFINGVLFSIGISPGDEIAAFIGKHEIILPPVLQAAMIFLPLIVMGLTIWNLIRAYRKGGLLGIVAIILAFVAGSLIIKEWQTSVALLIAAMAMGIVGFRRRK